MEILFEDKEERGVYQERYDINKILDQKEGIVSSMGFGKVDFEGR